MLQSTLACASLLALPIQADYTPFMPEQFWPLCIAAYLCMFIDQFSGRRLNP